MEPVNDIWIFPNVPKALRNRVFVYDPRYVEVGGEGVEGASGLVRIACVYVGDPDEAGNLLSQFLGTLFFPGAINRRDENLERKYKITLDDSSIKELDRMNMLAEWAEDLAEEMADEKVKEADEKVKNAESAVLALSVEFVVTLVRDFSVSLDDAISRLNIPGDQADAVRTEAEAILSSGE